MSTRKRMIDNQQYSKKKQKIDLEPYINEEWISATRVRNYMLNDPLLDWLNLYGESKGYIKDSKSNSLLQNKLNFTKYIMEKGNEFEKYIIDKLKEKHNNDFVSVDCSTLWPIQKKYIRQIKETYELMSKGVKIIYQGLVFNPINKTYGYPDLIVRSDYLNELVNNHPAISSEESKIGCIFSDEWHYRVIDIKFTTLKLKANETTLLNQGSVLPYKAQTCIYNQAVGFIQHFTPNKSYLLGRGWSSNHNDVKYPFDKLAQVDFSNDDKEIEEDVCSAIEWVRDVRTQGNKWTILPSPSRPELYPNMCNDMDYDWHKTKSMLAKELAEITSVWNCGVKNRETAHESKVFQWTDEKCSSKTMGMGGKINPQIVDNILCTNRGKDKYTVDIDTLKTSSPEWKDLSSSFFIDFETVSNINDITNTEDGLIFMIGFGRDENNEWKFQSFITDHLNLESEKKIINNFLDCIEKSVDENKTCNLYHFSYAEPSHFNKALARHNITPRIKIQWIDILKIIKDSKFIVKGALDFSLKSIVSALSEQKMIDLNYTDSEITNGSEAMIAAFIADKTTNTTMSDIDLIKCVKKYNEIDCLTLKKVLKVLVDIIN